MSTDKTLDQQINLALAAARNSKSSLVSFSDLPGPWRYNNHIVHGYRFTESCSQCIRSVFRIHNESFNIWSHLLGCIFLVRTLLLGGLYPPGLGVDGGGLHSSDDAAAGITIVYCIYLIAAVFCMSCSVSWHTMRCISSHSTMSCFSSLDLMGVTLLAIASVLITQVNAFADSPSWLYVYMVTTLVLGGMALTACWLPIMRKPENSWARVIVWISLVFQGLALPVLHLMWTKGVQRTVGIYSLVMAPYGPIVIGAIIYASQFPECYWPGQFDYIGGSHNILHVLSLWAIWLGLRTLIQLSQSVDTGLIG